MIKLFRTRAYLKHQYLVYLDQRELFQKHCNETAEDVVFIADMILNTTQQNAQEVYDELFILKLIEVKNENGKDKVYLTDSGKKRLFHRHFQKEHWRIVENKFTTYGIIIANVVIATVSLILTARTNSAKELNEMRQLRETLKTIDTTLRQTQFSIIRDTVFLPMTDTSSKP